MRPEIAELESITEDWSGREIGPVKAEVLEWADKILDFINKKPTMINLTGRHSVQLEWHDGQKYLEIEVFEDHVVFLYKDGDTFETADQGTDYKHYLSLIVSKAKRFNDLFLRRPCPLIPPSY